MPIFHIENSKRSSIACNKCNGELIPVNKNGLTSKVLSTISCGKIRLKFFCCENCKEKFILI